MKPLLIADVLKYLGITGWDDLSPAKCGIFLEWPPDAFAIAAYLLRESGAYVQVVNHFWGKGNGKDEVCDTRQKYLMDQGTKWRKKYIQKKQYNPRLATKPGCPPSVIKSWRQFLKQVTSIGAKGTPATVYAILHDAELWKPLVDICAVADEASAGFGLFKFDENEYKNKKISYQVDFPLIALGKLFERLQLSEPATLCDLIDPSRATVLPKMHTAQMGITMRSMSHNLALGARSDIRALWATNLLPSREHGRRRRTQSRNLLVIPWPTLIESAQFMPADCAPGGLDHLPDHQDFFQFRPTADSQIAKRIRRLLTVSQKTVGPIDGIVFPEMALSSKQFENIFKVVFQDIQFLISGIYEPPKKNRLGKNYARICVKVDIDMPLKNSHRTKKPARKPITHYVDVRQDKHHRWFLDSRQIQAYGLGGLLDPARKWWECIQLSRRDISFFALDPLFVFTVLICEDLARPEPVGDMIRAVGPNLVVALLQDGPQMAHRWPARYATSLTDDPGCSVLTVTSLGMAQLSRPYDAKSGELATPSRIVALWRDASTGTREIALPKNADAFVLTLVEGCEEEWTADGRGDRHSTGSVTFGGVHYIGFADKETGT